MADETCSGKEDCEKKITQLLDKYPSCQRKTDIDTQLNTFKITPNISLANYKRLLCRAQSHLDRNWTRKCGEISQFKKSKKRSKSLRKPYRKPYRKSLRKTYHKSPTKSLRKKL
jgi:hypothetical protein